MNGMPVCLALFWHVTIDISYRNHDLDLPARPALAVFQLVKVH